MIYKIGVTGGIGSGKTYVCHIFESMGYPVFYSDIEAKRIIYSNEIVRSQIKKEIGVDSYLKDGTYNKDFVSSIVFSDPLKLKALNQIVHPAVRKAFDLWAKDQNSKIVFNEAALLFENGSWKDFDTIILIHADKETRISRLLKRDHSSEEEIMKRINSQWSDEKKLELAHYDINNSKNAILLPQIAQILSKIK